MSRHQRYEDQAEARYPALSQLLGTYLHQDWPEESGTPEAALVCAIADFPVEVRQAARREMKDLLQRADDNTELRCILNYGMHASVHFPKPSAARAFAEDVERRLVASLERGA